MPTDRATCVLALSDLAAVIGTAPPRLGRTRLVCVDGPAGSGKTSLAGRLEALLNRAGTVVAVVHMDDVYRGWETDFGEVHQRLHQQLLEPLSRGVRGRYQRYDWVAGKFTEWLSVAVCEVLLLEGVGSAPQRLAPMSSMVIWVEAPADVRLSRGRLRDGARVLPKWRAWMQHEDAEHRRERTRERADLRIDGSPSVDLPADQVLANRSVR